MVNSAVIGRDIMCIQKQALLKALEAGDGRGHFDAAGQEIR